MCNRYKYLVSQMKMWPSFIHSKWRLCSVGEPLTKTTTRGTSQRRSSFLHLLRRYQMVWKSMAFLHPSCLECLTSCGWFQVELYAVITGHGSDENGCGEFCVTSHHFLINGVYNTHTFDTAGKKSSQRHFLTKYLIKMNNVLSIDAE